MLNWLEIVANATWIFALALGLAVFGFAYWQKTLTGQTFLRVLSQHPSIIFLATAGGLFFLGLATSLPYLWAKILLLLPGGLSFVQAGKAFHLYRGEKILNLKNEDDKQDDV
jgi:hypothetical protein